jgi:hypothetical protein
MKWWRDAMVPSLEPSTHLFFISYVSWLWLWLWLLLNYDDDDYY